MQKNKFEQGKSVVFAGYKAMGMTKREIEKLLNIYPSDITCSSKMMQQQREKYEEALVKTMINVASRQDVRSVMHGLGFGVSALFFLSCSKSAYTCGSPKMILGFLALSSACVLFSYLQYKKLGIWPASRAKKIEKARQKAIKKLIACSKTR